MFRIPFNSLSPVHQQLNDEIRAAILSVTQKNQYVLGHELQSFEEEFAAFLGVRYSVGMGTGLDALHAALALSNVKSGDEVLVPAHTYIASWMAISRVGAVITPVDVREDTMLMDPALAGGLITKKTRAIMPVHLYGLPCDMDALLELAGSTIAIVEDNAQAHGATFNGKFTGSFSTCGATSFYPTKNLGAMGDGGAITTNDREIYEKVLAFRNYGSKERFVNDNEGTNSRLDELQAAVLRVKLRHLAQWNEERRSIAGIYRESLTGVGDIAFQQSSPQCKSVHHLFVIRTQQRDQLQRRLAASGIETMIHYPIPPHLQKVYSSLGFSKGDFPVAEKIATTALSLPLYPGMPGQHVEEICESIRAFY